MKVREYMQSLGSTVGRYTASTFYHAIRDMKVTVHGDDFLATGPEIELIDLQNKMMKRFKCKHTMVSQKSKEKSLKMLNRVIMICNSAAVMRCTAPSI